MAGYPGSDQQSWPDVSGLVESELPKFLAAVRADPAVATRCAPWSAADVAAHVAETFRRYADLLEQSRAGDMSPPFAREELSGVNLKAVEEFSGDAIAAAEEQVARFLALATDPEETMAHQFGPIPVALQMLFGLNELVLHHVDVADASGGSYRPANDVVQVLLLVWEKALDLADPEIADPWARILEASGR
jgi:uncharacterized protein (TIGR03083 family)